MTCRSDASNRTGPPGLANSCYRRSLCTRRSVRCGGGARPYGFMPDRPKTPRFAAATSSSVRSLLRCSSLRRCKSSAIPWRSVNVSDLRVGCSDGAGGAGDFAVLIKWSPRQTRSTVRPASPWSAIRPIGAAVVVGRRAARLVSGRSVLNHTGAAPRGGAHPREWSPAPSCRDRRPSPRRRRQRMIASKLPAMTA